MENNNARASLLVTTDGTFTRGDTIIEFFDKDGHYVGEITVWADGEIWAEAEDIDEEFRFESPQEFFQALQAISKSIISNPTINKTENYTTTNPAGEI